FDKKGVAEGGNGVWKRRRRRRAIPQARSQPPGQPVVGGVGIEAVVGAALEGWIEVGPAFVGTLVAFPNEDNRRVIGKDVEIALVDQRDLDAVFKKAKAVGLNGSEGSSGLCQIAPAHLIDSVLRYGNLDVGMGRIIPRWVVIAILGIGVGKTDEPTDQQHQKGAATHGKGVLHLEMNPGRNGKWGHEAIQRGTRQVQRGAKTNNQKWCR